MSDAIRSDVLVIGGGLAGTIAALAARGEGASVTLASRSWGATAFSSGALDLAFTPALSAVDQTERTVAEHVMDIIAHRHRHPYGILGLERSVDGLRRGYEVLRQALAGTDLELEALDLEAYNLGLPSSLGASLPAGSAFAPHRGIDLSRPIEGTWGVAQLEGDASFDAERVAAGVAHDAQRMTGRIPELETFSVSHRGAGNPMALARRFDHADAVAELGDALATRSSGLAGIIVPPVLGLKRCGEARSGLSDRLGCPVIEALAHLPSVPGVRLQNHLDAALAAAGVERVGEVRATRCDDSTVQSATLADGRVVQAGAFALATGRFIAGGISWEDECVETVFGLPVVTELGLLEEDSPLPVIREHPVESHPLMTSGVQVNVKLQPIREGAVAFDNLFAAGMVIGGFASRYTLCADGVALCSGYRAGRAAARGRA